MYVFLCLLARLLDGRVCDLSDEAQKQRGDQVEVVYWGQRMKTDPDSLRMTDVVDRCSQAPQPPPTAT